MRKVLLMFFLSQAVFSIEKRLPEKPQDDLRPLSAQQATRIDPHGQAVPLVALQKQNKIVLQECLVCHIDKKVTVANKINDENCFQCHNRAPHSGVVEHLNHKVGCVSCHSFHRWDPSFAAANSGIFDHLQSGQKLKDFVFRPGSGLMIKKSCKECHTWK